MISSKQRPLFEIQIHAPDIRRGVRYLFFNRWQAAGLLLLGLGSLGAIGWALWNTPQAVRDLHSVEELDGLETMRVEQQHRLALLTTRLEELAVQSEELGQRMEKIYLAYGLSQEGSIGQGGFPFVPEVVPSSSNPASLLHATQLKNQVTERVQVLDTFLQEIAAFEEVNVQQAHSTPSLSPLRGEDFVLTSPFGTRRNPFTKGSDFHAGIDLAAPSGSPIHAPADGVVVFAGRYDLRRSVGWWRYGNLVVLRHDERFITLFGHCDEVKVKRGDQVRQGDVIATVGNTGWSTNSHLHYEVRRKLDLEDYRPVDPRIYILDHRWRDEEKMLIRARSAPDASNFEPLPQRLSR
ncbi:MAG: M23 family metallopeptidase [Thermoanaerobaculia bacterium]|nr:M23 family metallopeptidase [Thermoanaerobaculia bacterium]